MPLSVKYTYQKKDKLKSRKQTQHLFSKGSAVSAFPIKLLYTIQDEVPAFSPEGLLQAGVGAPSRIFRKAVQRNKVKRLLREGYRLEKPSFVAQQLFQNKRLNLFFLYVDATLLSQQEIQEKIKIALKKLSDKIKAQPIV